MSTQRPEDISEAVIVPGAAAATVNHTDDALSPDDTLLQTNSGEPASPEELDQAAKSAEAEVLNKTNGNADAPAPINLDSNIST